MKFKIVTDSSADIRSLSGIPFESAPLKIITDEREYVDDASLNVVGMLSDLKKQIREVIEAVPDTDERMVLKYRYIHNYTWEQIGMELCADARTIRRWHGKALLHVTLPDDPIVI